VSDTVQNVSRKKPLPKPGYAVALSYGFDAEIVVCHHRTQIDAKRCGNRYYSAAQMHCADETSILAVSIYRTTSNHIRQNTPLIERVDVRYLPDTAREIA
jgi:hypothetical protein